MRTGKETHPNDKMLGTTERNFFNLEDDYWESNVSTRVKRIERIVALGALFYFLSLSCCVMHSYPIVTKNTATLFPNISDKRKNAEFHYLDIKLNKLSKKIDELEDEISRMDWKILSTKEESGTEAKQDIPTLLEWKKHMIPNSNLESKKNKSKMQESDSTESEHRQLLASSIFDIKPSFCDNKPILSAMNDLNNYKFDERIANTLSILQGITSPELILNFFTPQYRSACWILFDDELRIRPESNLFVERYILALIIHNFFEYDGVLRSMATCDYEFVQCNSGGHIQRIQLGNMRKSAGFLHTLPSEISKLQSLEYLDLSNQGLIGTIPVHLGLMASLKELKLNSNDLTGAIPLYFGNLKRLEVLALERNALSGPIPSELGQLSELKHLKLHHNEFEKSIPSELLHCRSLRELYLHDNHLTGQLPTNFNLAQSLRIVNIENNKLSGPIPSEIGTLSSLRELWVRFNNFSAKIPSQLQTMESLKLMIFGSNSFTGTIPDFFQTLYSLEVINFEKNNLTGRIPESIWTGRDLNAVILEGNNLIGTAPANSCSDLNFYSYDNSPWFVDRPKVECLCCDTSDCTLWDADLTLIGGTVRPTCPPDNIFSIDFFEQNWIQDNIANLTFRELSGMNLHSSTSLCLSRTGCYSMYDVSIDGSRKLLKYNMGYSSSSDSLRIQNECDAVDVCGIFIDMNHPKRKVLNHLTQLMGSSSIINKALCWIINEDKLFEEGEEYFVCDGTLLQRYIIALFFVSKNMMKPEFSTLYTCDWPGIKCDQSDRYIEHINFSKFNITGSIVTEIGLLPRLKTIDLSWNELDGTISPFIFFHLPNLELFRIDHNKMVGRIPKELFELPKAKTINISFNSFEGTLPTDTNYSKSLEGFFASFNLIQGSIPYEITSCRELRYLDISKNSLKGNIISDFANLQKLEVLRLDQNSLSGSIPHHLFSIMSLKVLELKSNLLTGSIPAEVGNVKKLTLLTLSHNQLKGNVPTEFAMLSNIELIHIHDNRLTGTFPEMKKLEDLGGESLIGDCGRPTFSLPSQFICDSCTICCNSEKMCQKTKKTTVPIEIKAAMAIAIVPIVFLFIIWLINKYSHRLMEKLWIKRNPLDVYNRDSVYSFIFSTSNFAKCLFVLIAAVQVAFLSLFLHASNIRNKSTDWIFTIRCSKHQLTCEDDKTVDLSGWFLFYTVTFLHLGVDFSFSTFQALRAAQKQDLKLFLSSFVLFALTGLALFTSEAYNTALAKNNRELIVNAVILLFINDLDEKFFSILKCWLPDWTKTRAAEIEASMVRRFANEDAETDNSDYGEKSSQIIHVSLDEHVVCSKEKKLDETNETTVKRPHLQRYESGKRMLGLSADEN